MKCVVCLKKAEIIADGYSLCVSHFKESVWCLGYAKGKTLDKMRGLKR